MRLRFLRKRPLKKSIVRNDKGASIRQLLIGKHENMKKLIFADSRKPFAGTL